MGIEGKSVGVEGGEQALGKNDGGEGKSSLHARFSAAVLMQRLLSLCFPLTFMLILKKRGKRSPAFASRPLVWQKAGSIARRSLTPIPATFTADFF